eukprot:snap_masked-scaffold_29-processed-gene-2.37-mRNA-1 protein AED:1.00 eAED:1.00 QI:0/0/0/0/1/1/4/0/446
MLVLAKIYLAKSLEKPTLTIDQRHPFHLWKKITNSIKKTSFGHLSASLAAENLILEHWWLKRYIISNEALYTTYIIFRWTTAAFGSFCLPFCCSSLTESKFPTHLTYICRIILGAVVALSLNYSTSFNVFPFGFFSGALIPFLLAEIFIQVEPHLFGCLSGLLKLIQSLSRLVVLYEIAQEFHSYVKPFRPDDSCLQTLDLVDGSNDCLCGVEACPVFIGPQPSDFQFIPSMCENGELTAKIRDKPSKGNPPLDDSDPYSLIPQEIFEFLSFIRPNDCVVHGLVRDTDGVVIEEERSWCIGTDEENQGMNEFLGCPGYDYSAFSFVLGFHACSTLDQDLLNTTRLNLTELNLGELNTDCTEFRVDPNFASAESVELFAGIHERILLGDLDKVGEDIRTEEFGYTELNGFMVSYSFGGYVFYVITHFIYCASKSNPSTTENQVVVME